MEVSLKALEFILSFKKTLPDKVSNVMKLCRNCVGLFYKLLHKLSNQSGNITGEVRIDFILYYPVPGSQMVGTTRK